MPGTMTNQPADTTFPCPFCRADVSPQAERCPQCNREPVIAGYRVRSLLGRGGMGVVLGAERTGDGLPVAVKVLWLGEGVDWKAIELFERSTRVLQGLRHPLLPEVRAFERDERGTLILVRDRFDGGSLGERIRSGRPRLDRQGLRRLLEKLLGLLSYLHGQVPPVLHRDIKPDNILFRTADDWEPVLVDFDTVAAPGPQSKRLTVICTPGYTAPEQLAGDPCPASDLYSLGATMLFVATGTEPDELPRRDGRFEVEPLLAGLDAGVRTTVLRMVEPSLTERPRSAEEALQVLGGAEEEEPRAKAEEESRAEPRRRGEPQVQRKEPAMPWAAEEPWKVELKLPKVTDTVPRKPWGMRIGVGAITLTTATVFYLALCADDPSLKFWIGTQDVAAQNADFAVFRSGEKELLVGIEPIERTRFLSQGRLVRLTRIDGRSGKVLGRSDVGDAQWDVLGYGSQVLWLMEPEKCGLQARDPWTGNLLTDTAGIARANPQLADRMLLGEDANSTGCWAVNSPAANGDDLLLKLRDGSQYLVKAGSWQAAPVLGEPEELDTWRVGDLAEGSGSSDFQLGTDYWALEGDGDRMRLRYENKATGAIQDPLPGSETFLEGTFVCWGAYCDPPLTLTNPDGFLVTYQSGIDVHHPDMLARITRDGRTVWTFALGPAVKDLDEYRGLFQLAAHIVVVAQTQGEDSEGDTAYSTWLIALDAATGREAWRYRP
jgi:hypothetical protein